VHLRVAPWQRSAATLLGLRGGGDDPRLPDWSPELLAAATEVEGLEAGSDVVAAREDGKRCLGIASQFGALRVVLGQLEVAYRTDNRCLSKRGAVDDFHFGSSHSLRLIHTRS